MAFVLALDQGTTSSRALVFDHGGAVRGMAQQELRQIYPEPGWVEHDPTEIWATQSGVMHDALRAAGHEAALAAKTGLVLDAYFSGTKLKWLLDHLPGARVRAES